MRYQKPQPIVLRVSRESPYFELGFDVGNVDLYCKTVIDFVVEAIAMDVRANVFSSQVTAWSYLNDCEQVIAHFAFVVGRHLDLERITNDLNFLYTHLRSAIDVNYPNWSYNCPGLFRVQITPGSFNFLVDL